MRTTLVEPNGDFHDVNIVSFVRGDSRTFDEDYNQFEFVHSEDDCFDIGQIVEFVATNSNGETDVFYIRCVGCGHGSSTWQMVADSPDRFEWLECQLEEEGNEC